MLRIALITLSLGCICCLLAAADNSGRIYGKIYTVDGDELEGLIRWDKNEGGWVDVLDGNKDRRSSRGRSKSSRRRYRDRDSNVKLFGITIGGSTYYDYSSAESGIRFGHIKSLEPIGDDEVLLVLKSGEEVELEGGSTDIGDGIREIIIEDEREGELELDWDDIDRIEFEQARTSETSNFGERLYGTLTTRRDEKFTGFLCWDTDELFERDILDGDERRRSRRVRFDKIAAIERYSSSGATIYLKGGDEMVLKNSNDIDSGNRGISILDLKLGQVSVDWDDFERFDFEEAPGQAKYEDFDGGRKLYGTVYTDDGEKHTGEIRWDDDEEYTWELLDGKYRGIDFEIEFGQIASIERKSSRGSIITLTDGREFQLRESNDVDDDNKGIFVTLEDGDEVEVDWYDFEKVEFSGK